MRLPLCSESRLPLHPSVKSHTMLTVMVKALMRIAQASKEVGRNTKAEVTMRAWHGMAAEVKTIFYCAMIDENDK